MGRKKLEPKSVDELFLKLSKMFVPENLLEDFDIWDCFGKKGNYILELREKENLIPAVLKGNSEVVLDGFCNPIDMLSIGFSLGPVYLRIYRRRWKLSNDDKHFSNEYDLQLKGFKLVPEMGFFLKEEDRRLSY